MNYPTRIIPTCFTYEKYIMPSILGMVRQLNVDRHICDEILSFPNFQVKNIITHFPEVPNGQKQRTLTSI